VTGRAAVGLVQKMEDRLKEAAECFRANPDELLERIKKLQDEVKSLKKGKKPEAAAGGPIGLLRPGDRIRIDIDKRLLEVDLSDAELKARRAAWRAPEPRVKTGWLYRYSKMVTSGSQGAVLRAE